MKNIIIADSSPLIILARINHLFVLEEAFEKILIPVEVEKECLFDIYRPGASAIQSSIVEKKIEVFRGTISLQNELKLPSILGPGETAAICLAHQLKNTLMIDDLWGRKFAQQLQIPIIGTAGLLIFAKKRKIIKEIKPIIMQLQENNFHMSDSLIQKILALGNEVNQLMN